MESKNKSFIVKYPIEMRRRMQARLYFYVKQFTIDYLTKEQQNKLHEDYQTTIGFGQLTLSIINRTPDANAVPITCGEQYFYRICRRENPLF